MDIKLCRICGKQDDNFINIFKTEGLKNKIETCLPIVITRQCPLPNTICNSCLDSVDNFYSFIKKCLQNIIVLEAQYEIIESCLKTKRKVDKCVYATESDILSEKIDVTLNVNRLEIKNVDVTSEIVKPILNTINNITPNVIFTKDSSPIPNFSCSLVDYDSSDSDEENIDSISEFIQRTSKKTEEIEQKPIQENITVEKKIQNTQPEQNNLINEIVQRKYLKRKNEDVVSNVSKIARIENESSSRRKSKAPKRVEYHLETKLQPIPPIIPFSTDESISEKLLNLPADLSVTREDVPIQEPMQTCLLCEQQFFGPIPLTTHMYETHGIDLAQVFAVAQTQPTPVEKPSPKKKLPELVKITDVFNVRKQLPQDNYDEPPVLEPQVQEVNTPQSPVIVPALNRNNYTCQECDGETTVYTTFKEYSNHRRSQHQIFHCDLCPKFYGRNSHLWKHVNRVHKGHPSITCQQCYKTSASKYHLAQHFNKMHSVKSQKPKPTPAPKTNSGYCTPEENDEDFMTQKFQGFDFKSVRQSFLRQDMLDKQKKKDKDEDEESVKSNKTNEHKKDPEEKTEENKVRKEVKYEPKEIDSSSNLYTNIITNYTPPTNEGAYKCPKCFKGFHKKNLLKKHKKNCRPRLQKDLLTRCKTCSRIFKDRQSLAKHLINYHSLYKCEICYLEVQSKCEIVSHIRFSHPNSELTCHCGQILRSKTDLQKHKLDHRDSHVCQFCGDMLPTKIKLKMHILSLHRKILSLSCGICLKLFETQHILRDHVNVVHGDQLSPLTSCTVCGKNYGSKWKTYDHLNKSHGRIFKACKACLEVFESEQELQKHFEMDHLNSKSNSEKKTQKTEKEVFSDANENMQDFVQGEDGSTSETEDEETSGESSGMQPKTIQEDMDYRNYIIKEFKTNLEKKENGIKSETKKSDLKSQENKLSLLEKRLLGQKIKDEDTKKKKDILENGNKSEKKKHIKNERYDEDPMQNSSKRTVYVNSNDPSLCEICLKVWPAKKHLWQHYIRCHKQVAATVCGICLKTNPSYSSLQTHLRETHPNLLYGCGFGSNFICKICGRYHNASSKLKLHMAIHVGFNESMLDSFKDMKEEMPVLEQEKNPTDEESIEYDPNEVLHDDIKLEIKEEIIGNTEDDDVNYESLIEEVEVYSDSDQSVTQNVQEQMSEEESDAEGEESEVIEDSENEGTENELEQEMLKNMIGENVTIVTNQDSNDTDSYQSLDVKQEIIIDDFDCKVKMEDSSSDEWTNSPEFLKKSDDKIVLYQRKELELDNAIRSISYDSPENDNSQFSDVNSSLNENEIEAAVEEHSSSETEDEEISTKSTGVQRKTIQKNINYRRTTRSNCKIKQFHTNLEKKKNKIKSKSKKSLKSHENKFSYIIKRLLGQKIRNNFTKKKKNIKNGNQRVKSFLNEKEAVEEPSGKSAGRQQKTQEGMNSRRITRSNIIREFQTNFKTMQEDVNSRRRTRSNVIKEFQTKFKTMQEDIKYRRTTRSNRLIKEFPKNLEEKKNIKSESKKSDLKPHKNKLLLTEKRLLDQKIKDSKKKYLETGNKSMKNELTKNDRKDENPMQYSWKRTVYENNNAPSPCEICLRVLPAKKHLWQHYIKAHKEEAATICGICLKTNPSYYSLQIHLKETHPKLLYGCDVGSKFVCKICGKYHSALGKLTIHMVIHEGFNEDMLDNFNDIDEEMPVLELQQYPDEENIEYEPFEMLYDDIKLEIKEEIIRDTDDYVDYESLSKEVEYPNSESITKNVEEQIPEEVSGVEREESEVIDSENEGTEKEVEQMGKNMIGKNVIIITNEDSNDATSCQLFDVKQEIIIEDFDVDSCKVKIEESSSDEWTNSPEFSKKSDDVNSSLNENEVEAVEEISSKPSGVEQKTMQENIKYRRTTRSNRLIKGIQTNLEERENSITSESKKSDLKPHKNQPSLREKRLLGQKVKDDSKKKDLETGNKSENNEHTKNGRYDENPMQISWKRSVYENNDDLSPCEICFRVFPAKRHLWQHYIKVHNEEAATVCGICLKTNPSYSSLKIHLQETHPKLLYGCGAASNFVCKICGRYHNAICKLKLHVAIHAGLNDYEFN